jgi:hypothetical protein
MVIPLKDDKLVHYIQGDLYKLGRNGRQVATPTLKQ